MSEQLSKHVMQRYDRFVDGIEAVAATDRSVKVRAAATDCPLQGCGAAVLRWQASRQSSASGRPREGMSLIALDGSCRLLWRQRGLRGRI